MELHRIIKSDARKALRRYWGRSVAAMLIVFAAYLAISISESVLLFVFSGKGNISAETFDLASTTPEVLVILGCTALAFCLLMPGLLLGFKKLHLGFAKNAETAVYTLFDCFSSFREFFRSLIFSLLLSLRCTAVTLFSLIPGAALIYAAYTYIQPQNRTVYMLKVCAYCVGVIIGLLCLAMGLIFMQRWFAAPYYLVSGSGIHKAFALSVKATRNMNSEIIRFKLSYFGWALLSVFAFPLLWSLPYYSVAEAIYAEYLMERQSRSGGCAFSKSKKPFEHRKSCDEHASAPDDSFYESGEHEDTEPEHDSEELLKKSCGSAPENKPSEEENKK